MPDEGQWDGMLHVSIKDLAVIDIVQNFNFSARVKSENKNNEN